MKNYQAMIKKIYSISHTYFLWCLLQAILGILTPLVLLFLPTFIIDAFLQGAGWKILVLYTAVCVTVPMLAHILKAVVDRKVHICAQKVEHGLDYAVDDAFMYARYEQLEKSEIYEKLQRIREGKHMAGPVTGMIQYQFFGLLSNVICLITYLSVFVGLLLTDGMPFSPVYLERPPFLVEIIARSTWLFLAIQAGLCALTLLARRKGQKREQKIVESFSEVGRKYGYFVRLRADYENGADIRLNGLYRFLRREIDDYNQKERCMHRSMERNNTRFHTLAVLATRLQEFLAYGFIVCKILYGVVTLGGFYLYSNAVTRTANCITVMFQQLNDIRYGMSYYGAYCDLWEIKKAGDVVEEEAEQKEGWEEKPDPEAEIEFRNVSFQYPGSEIWIFRNFNLCIRPGEHIAIVGKNGAGKSTLIKLLMGLYEIQEGAIYVHGRNIRSMKREELYSLFGTVFQDYRLLDATVGSNVAAVEEGYDTEKVRRILKEVGLLSTLSKDGEKTRIFRHLNEDGIVLSGGEEQKVAIARALYKEARYLILDEPAASLDPIAEKEINEQMERLSREHTAIIISHRLSSCYFCDRILVLEQGELLESGTHGELLALGKTYAKMWSAQAQYYREEQPGQSEESVVT